MSLSPIALDYETADDRGPSTDFYRKDFRVTSVALTWSQDGSLSSVFYDTPSGILRALKRLHDTQRPIIVHNLQFEMGVTMACYPDLNLNWQFDTMRMAQLRDSGGTPDQLIRDRKGIGEFLGIAQAKKRIGMGLEKCASRFLPPEDQNHKQEAHNWLRDNHGIKTKFGLHLDLLPRDVLSRYNTLDTEITYKLWKSCSEYFYGIGFNDRVDWQLYRFRTELYCTSKLDGFPIDRPALLEYIRQTEQEIFDIDREFLEYCGAEELREFEQEQAMADVVKKVSRKENHPKALASRLASGKFTLNPNSTQQKAKFLMEYKGIKPVLFTHKGAPAMDAGSLWQWGQAGDILARKNKLQIKLHQAMGIYLASEYDGRWHVDVKSSTTSTDRVRGGNDV